MKKILFWFFRTGIPGGRTDRARAKSARRLPFLLGGYQKRTAQTSAGSSQQNIAPKDKQQRKANFCRQ